MAKDSKKIEMVQMILKLTFGIVPIVAGLDKFTNFLTQWSNYLNPTLAGFLPISPAAFIAIIGVIEIVAGVLVLVRPRIGAYVVSAWLTLIALSLVASWNFLDVAVRDLVMAIGAYSLAQLTEALESK
jgi:uncharacterized membrane protein YphA (DoxX/SURF4 family)